MSLLSILEATPNRIRAVTRLVATLDGATRQVLRAHLMPNSEAADQFAQLMRETIRLGLVSEDADGRIFLAEGVSQKQVANESLYVAFVEAALLTDQSEASENRALRYALAWLLAQPAGTAIAWNSEQHPSMQAQMDGNDNYDVTNQSRFAMLCYWARYLGYASSLPIGKSTAVVPDPSVAIARRLDAIFAGASRLPIAQFFAALGGLIPVVETGSVRRSIELRMREKRQSNMLSIATSLALLRLESRALLKLTHASDAETWLLTSSVETHGAGRTRQVSHLEYAAPRT